jgi:molecular chaperone Hsp33
VSDSLQRFLLERSGVRGAVVQLRDSWQHALSRVEHPESVRSVLGHAIVASALLASTLKFKGTLTLQVQGQGPLELLVVQCTQALALRGIAKAKPAAATLADFRELAGGGHLAVTIEASETERYQGIVPLARSSLAACLEEYFHRSEQLATRLWLASDTERAAGLLLQRLPEADEAQEDDWPGCRHWRARWTGPSCSGRRPRRCSNGCFHASPCACADRRRHTFIARARVPASSRAADARER